MSASALATLASVCASVSSAVSHAASLDHLLDDDGQHLKRAWHSTWLSAVLKSRTFAGVELPHPNAVTASTSSVDTSTPTVERPTLQATFEMFLRMRSDDSNNGSS